MTSDKHDLREPPRNKPPRHSALETLRDGFRSIRALNRPISLEEMTEIAAEEAAIEADSNR